MSDGEQTEAAAAPRPKGRLTNGSIAGHLTRMAIPMSWGLFAIIGINLVDTFFVAQLGTRELAAISFTFPVVFFMISLAIGLGVGASSVIARAIGSGDRERVQRLTTAALSLALVIVAGISLIGILTIEPLFRALGAEPDLIPRIAEYMGIWYLGMVFLVVPMVGNSCLRAAGDSFWPSMAMTIVALVNLVLDPILIFGLFGVPRLELEGAAIATVIARAVGLAISLWLLHYRERMILWALPPPRQLLADWKAILHVGLPAALSNVIVPVGLGAVTAIVASYGEAAVAAFGVVTRIEAICLVPIFALSAVIGPVVGQNWGSGLTERACEARRLVMQFSLAYGLFVSAVLILGGRYLVPLFNDDPQVVETGVLYFWIVPLCYAGYAAVMTSAAVFNALGRPWPASALTVTRALGLYVPLSFLGSVLFGLVGIFVGIFLANVLTGFAALIAGRRLMNAPTPAPATKPSG